ncbi:SRPBCC family protein [uncultured Enterovirga sp.]|uniref:SRPBCC family protein n=1 Tax=uncultured Enterovirga sp. TaxID=2026352 RepID=UPI0035CC107D
MTRTVITLILLLIGAGIVAVLALAATRPDTFQVRRQATIAASPDRIFPLIADLRRWQPWSPYERKDPGMKRGYRGPAEGPGSIYEWEGDKNVGAGRIELTDVTAPRRVAMKLDMLKPFEAQNQVEFLLEPVSGGTEVTWVMRGEVPYFAKIIHLFFNMDRMVGGDFEAGLANLRQIAESPATAELGGPRAP